MPLYKAIWSPQWPSAEPPHEYDMGWQMRIVAMMDAVLQSTTTKAVIRAARTVYWKGKTFMYSNNTEVLAIVKAIIQVN